MPRVVVPSNYGDPAYIAAADSASEVAVSVVRTPAAPAERLANNACSAAGRINVVYDITRRKLWPSPQSS